MEENKEVETITNEEQPVQEQPTVQSVEPNNNDKKGNNKKLILIISIIAGSLVVIGAVVLFLVFNNSDDDSDDNYNDEPETTEVEEDKKETTEDATKNEDKKEDSNQEECNRKVKDKSDEVNKILGKTNLLDTIYADTFYLNNNYNYSQISDAAKFYIAIRDVLPEHDKVVEKNTCIDFNGQQYCENYEVVSFSSVKQAHKDIFGIESNINSSNINSIKTNENEPVFLHCPAVVKLENDDIYLSNKCGGTYGEGVYGDYVYDYKKNDTTVEVYVAVAYFKHSTGYKNTIYKDYEYKNVYKKDVESKDCIKIDKDNYDEFSKFKVIYEKNSSDKYIFKSSERIS